MCFVVQLLNKFHVGVEFQFQLWVVNSSRLVISKNKKIFFFFRRLWIFERPHSQKLNIAVFSSDRPKIVCAPVGGRVSVPCPGPSAGQVKFSLFKDGEAINQYTCNRGINTSLPNTNTVGVDSKEAENNWFNFTLPGVNVSSHGIYTCEGVVSFPPPLKNLPSTPGILLLIEGKYSSGIECTCWIFQHDLKLPSTFLL